MHRLRMCQHSLERETFSNQINWLTFFCLAQSKSEGFATHCVVVRSEPSQQVNISCFCHIKEYAGLNLFGKNILIHENFQSCDEAAIPALAQRFAPGNTQLPKQISCLKRQHAETQRTPEPTMDRASRDIKVQLRFFCAGPASEQNQTQNIRRQLQA